MAKTIDIENYQDFIDAGFKECSGCGWALDPAEFDRHDCDEFAKAAHNHLEEDKCTKKCPLYNKSPEGN